MKPAYAGPRYRALLPLGLAFLVLSLALFLGLASAFLPGWFVISVLVLPAVVALTAIRPEYALTVFVALTCGLFHPALVPRVPLLGGSISAADATLAMLAAYALWLVANRSKQTKPLPATGTRLLVIALGVFGVSFVVSVAVSLGVRQLSPTVVLGEARDLLYLVTLPIAVMILHERERQKRFVVSFVILGCLFAAGQVLQGVLNIQIFGGSGQMVTLETLGQQEYGTTRSLTRGINVIVFALLLTVGAYVLDIIKKPLFFAVTGLLLTGIFLTFGRTTYAAVIVSLIVLVSWLNIRKLLSLSALLFIAVALGSALGSVLKPQSAEAIYYRMTSIGKEIESGYSAKWRYWEAEAMLPHIRQYPFTGLGLGADYKGSSGSSVFPDLNRYMHNAYLYMGGKMGLPALASFLVFMLSILFVGRKTAKSHTSPWERMVGAACAAMMVRFFVASITEPHFMSDYGLINIAIAGALAYLSGQGSFRVGASQFSGATRPPHLSERAACSPGILATGALEVTRARR